VKGKKCYNNKILNSKIILQNLRISLELVVFSLLGKYEQEEGWGCHPFLIKGKG
jgi:hypothetical protein